jgi:hypothetical protein
VTRLWIPKGLLAESTLESLAREDALRLSAWRQRSTSLSLPESRRSGKGMEKRRQAVRRAFGRRRAGPRSSRVDVVADNASCQIHVTDIQALQSVDPQIVRVRRMERGTARNRRARRRITAQKLVVAVLAEVAHAV